MIKKLPRLLNRVLRRYLPGVAQTILSLRNLFSVMGPKTKRNIFLLQFLMFFSSLVGVLSLVSVVPFLSMAAIPEKVTNNRWFSIVRDFTGIESNNDMLVVGGIFSLVMLFISHMLSVLLTIINRYIKDQISLDALGKIADYYLSAGHEFHVAKNSGLLFNNMFDKASQLISDAVSSVLEFNRTILTLIVAMSALFILNPILMVLSLVLMTSVLSFSILKNSRKNRDLQEVIQASGQLDTILTMETLRALEDIKVMGREVYFSQRLRKIREVKFKSSRLIAIINLWFRPFMEIIVYGIVVGLIIFYALYVPNANVLPELILFGLLSYRLMPTFNGLYSIFMTLQRTMVIHDFIGEDLLLAYRHTMKPRAKRRIDFQDTLDLKDVCYQYPNASEKTLTDINLSIPQGSWVGFCGPSGSGKTTLMKILLGFLPFKGEILVDGCALDKKTMPEWQNLLGYVSQNINLIDTSILGNVTLGLPEELIDREQAQKVLEMAELSDFISSLPKGVDSKIGENGIRISGGQRQRLIIARALYGNPEVLVFDEATSALDNIVEYEIIKTLRRLVGRQTVLMVAHRLSTIKDCDMLVFMKEGRIRATGSHEELMAHSADFREMAEKENKEHLRKKKRKRETEGEQSSDRIGS